MGWWWWWWWWWWSELTFKEFFHSMNGFAPRSRSWLRPFGSFTKNRAMVTTWMVPHWRMVITPCNRWTPQSWDEFLGLMGIPGFGNIPLLIHGFHGDSWFLSTVLPSIAIYDDHFFVRFFGFLSTEALRPSSLRRLGWRSKEFTWGTWQWRAAHLQGAVERSRLAGSNILGFPKIGGTPKAGWFFFVGRFWETPI